MSNSRCSSFANCYSTLFTKIKESKLDKWTTISIITNGVASYISNTWWIADWIDTSIELCFAPLEDGGLGQSWWALGFAAGASVILAAGTAYASGVQNYRFQPKDNSAGDDLDQAALSEPDEATALVPSNNTKLAFWQKGALACFAVTFTGDNAGVITFIGEKAAKDRLPVYGSFLLLCGATLWGVGATGADFRTCKKNMLLFVENKQRHNQRPLSQVIVDVDDEAPVHGPTMN